MIQKILKGTFGTLSFVFFFLMAFVDAENPHFFRYIITFFCCFLVSVAILILLENADYFKCTCFGIIAYFYVKYYEFFKKDSVELKNMKRIFGKKLTFNKIFNKSFYAYLRDLEESERRSDIDA